MIGTKIPVVIEVASAAKDPHGRLEEASQVLFPGTLEQRSAEEWILRYQETQEDEADHSRMTHDVYVQVKGQRVTVLRKGPYSMMMVLEHGKRYQTDYHTPYGDMAMGVYPIQVQTRMAPESGTVRLEYQLDLQGDFASVRRMQLSYTLTESVGKPC